MDVSGVILQVATTRNIYKRSAEEVPSTRIHPARLCQPKMERNNPISPWRYNLSCCLIGILIIFIMVYCNSHTSWVFYNPQKNSKQPGALFFVAQRSSRFFCCGGNGPGFPNTSQFDVGMFWRTQSRDPDATIGWNRFSSLSPIRTLDTYP